MLVCVVLRQMHSSLVFAQKHLSVKKSTSERYTQLLFVRHCKHVKVLILQLLHIRTLILTAKSGVQGVVRRILAQAVPRTPLTPCNVADTNPFAVLAKVSLHLL